MKYYLKAFGFTNFTDLVNTLFMKASIFYSVFFSFSLATITSFITNVMGFNLGAFFALFILIIAEWFTGMKASVKHKRKIESRKMGRMVIKIGVYMGIIALLNTLATNINLPPLFNIEINPLQWIYYVALLYIVFQLIVSLLENLGQLGYNEAEKLSKIFKGKFSSYFEINGEKDNDKFDKES